MSIMASDSTDHGAQRKLSVVEAPQVIDNLSNLI